MGNCKNFEDRLNSLKNYPYKARNKEETMILEEFWELYKRDLKTSVREISFFYYKDSIERCFNKVPWLLKKDVTEIKEEDIVSVKEILCKYYVPISVYRFLNLLRNLLDIALKKEILKENILRNIKFPRINNSVIDVISKNDFKNIIDEIKKSKINDFKKEIILFLTLLFKTGLRHSEARALRWQDIKFDKNSISITHSLYCTNYREYKLTDTKTRSSRRTIHIDNKLSKQLKEYKETKEFNKNNNFVFCNKEGKPRIAEFAKYHLNKSAKKLNLKITTHGLRHSHASILLNNKINILLISRRLGHSSVEMTLKLYCHLIEEDDSEITNLMEFF